jgi:hypothetical protein
MALRPPSRASKFARPKSRDAPVGDADARFVGPGPDSDSFPFPPPERARLEKRATAPRSAVEPVPSPRQMAFPLSQGATAWAWRHRGRPYGLRTARATEDRTDVRESLASSGAVQIPPGASPQTLRSPIKQPYWAGRWGQWPRVGADSRRPCTRVERGTRHLNPICSHERGFTHSRGEGVPSCDLTRCSSPGQPWTTGWLGSGRALPVGEGMRHAGTPQRVAAARLARRSDAPRRRQKTRTSAPSRGRG